MEIKELRDKIVDKLKLYELAHKYDCENYDRNAMYDIGRIHAIQWVLDEIDGKHNDDK